MRRVAFVRPREWPLVLAFALPALAAWFFVELGEEVLEGSTAAIDRAILLALRNPDDLSDPLGPVWFEELSRDITALGGYGVLTMITVMGAGYLLLIGKRRAAIVMVIAICGGVAISTLAKHGYARLRPDVVTHGVRVSTASFPSGHSTGAAVVYLTIAAMIARVHPSWRVKVYVLGCAVLTTMLVGFSRIYLGVHWPTDVLAGWSIGSAWALVCWATTLLLQRRGEVERDTERPPR